MPVQVKVDERTAWVNLVSQNGNILEVDVDGKIYRVDLLHTADGTFSIIEGNHSFNIELVPLKAPKQYTAYTLYKSYEVAILDAEARYLQSRGGAGFSNKSNSIASPMPGKVVKILTKEGDEVTEGQTVIIISAMKMESEYKAPKNSKVTKINVKEGDTVDSNQVLIELE